MKHFKKKEKTQKSSQMFFGANPGISLVSPYQIALDGAVIATNCKKIPPQFDQ